MSPPVPCAGDPLLCRVVPILFDATFSGTATVTYTFDPAAVPVPATLLLLAAGLAVAAGLVVSLRPVG